MFRLGVEEYVVLHAVEGLPNQSAVLTIQFYVFADCPVRLVDEAIFGQAYCDSHNKTK